MATRQVPASYDEIVESDEFEALEGGEYAETTGVYDNSVVKILGEAEKGIITRLAYTDPTEPGFSVDERTRRVVEFTESQEGQMYNAPEIIDFHETGVVEVEYLNNALDFVDFARIEDPELVRNISEGVGKALKDMHENDWAYRDFNYGNLMVEREDFDGGHEVYFTDPEFAKKDPTPQDKAFDLAAFIHTYGSLESETAQPVIEGFQEGYGFNNFSKRIAGLVGSSKLLALDRDIIGSYRNFVNTV